MPLAEDPLVPVPVEALAGRWFDVHGIHQRTGPAWMIGAYVKTILLMFITVGLSLLWYEPRRFCGVVLVRRDDGSTVLRYDYESDGDATHHVVRLRGLLATRQVFDFCRELGVPLHHVVGGGEEWDPEAPTVWHAVDRRDRWTEPGPGRGQ